MNQANQEHNHLLLFLQGAASSTETPHHRLDEGERRYRKDVIRCGRWFVPHLEMWLEVNEERMDRWVASFQQMLEQGVSVDLTIDHRSGAESRRGELVKLFRESDTLFMEVDVADEETELLMQRCPQVSLELQRHFIDGHGTSYEEALTAVSIVRQPVAAGQGEFVPVESEVETHAEMQVHMGASRHACYGFQQDASRQEEKNGVEACWRPLLVAMGIDVDLTVNEAIAAGLEHCQEQQLMLGIKQSEPELLDSREKMALWRLDRLCESGRISPAVHESCQSLIRQEHEMGVVMLSCMDGQASLADRWLTALADLPARSWESETGPQLMSLSDPLKSSAGDLTQQMIAEANRDGQYQV